MDPLQRSSFFEHLTGEVFLSQYHAMARLDPETTCRAARAAPSSASRHQSRLRTKLVPHAGRPGRAWQYVSCQARIGRPAIPGRQEARRNRLRIL